MSNFSLPSLCGTCTLSRFFFIFVTKPNNYENEREVVHKLYLSKSGTFNSIVIEIKPILNKCDHSSLFKMNLNNGNAPPASAETEMAATKVDGHTKSFASVQGPILELSAEMQNLEVQPPKTSGSNRKKSRNLKAETGARGNASAGTEKGKARPLLSTLLNDSSVFPTARPGEGRGGNSGPEQGMEQPAQPSTSSGMPVSGSSVDKRSSAALDKSATGNNPSKRVKGPRPSKSPKKLNDVVKDAHKLVILNGSDQSVGLNDELAGQVEDLLMSALDDIPASSGSSRPCFHGRSLENGNMVISCTNDESVQWLKKAITDINSSGAMKLIFKMKNELPRLEKARIWIPGKYSDDDSVMSRLAAQNHGLRTSAWKIYYSGKASNKGRLLSVGVDAKSLEIVRGLGFKLFYGLQKVAVTMQSKKARNNRT